ncbi:MAG: M55 family metallopeptidase [Proteobacteria bacterium]|nr:M55 family metallopeptidase [Pseudomonadota bacterium]
MKVYVSVDIEGVACVAAPSETDIGQPAEYGPFREQMSREAAAACEAAFAAGADAVVVKDAHATGRNIDPRLLQTPQGRQLELIRGWSGHPFAMVQGLDDSFDAVVFVGFHSAAGSDGSPLAHTVNGRLFTAVRLNGEPASEFRLYAMAAASVGVPVVFVSGDDALCGEARRLIEGIGAVAVLQGSGQSVRSVLPGEATRRIREGVERAITSPCTSRIDVPPRLSFVLEFAKAADAYARSFYPGVQQISPRELQLDTNRLMDVLTFLRFAARYQ